MTTELAIALERLDGFPDPDPALEQYATPAEIASRILTLADRQGDLDERVVDLGCGTGVLGVGAALAGASAVGVDVDRGALAVAARNAAAVGVGDAVGWIRADVAALPLAARGVTVVMNPPFGAQRRGADRPFLEAATAIGDAVYTVHNAGSRDFVAGFVDGEITHAYEATLALPRSFDFHTEDRRDVTAEVYRIACGPGDG